MLKKMIAILLSVLLVGQCLGAWAETVTELVFTKENGAYTISTAGTYRLSGETANGQLIIAAAKKSKITLILAGVSMANENGPVITSENSVDVTIELENGTENRLTSGTAVTIGEITLAEEVDGAAIKLKGDLTIAGEGALFVGGYINNGIQASGSVKLKSGSVTVEAVHNGIRGKEGVKVKGGTVTITSGNDGISAADEAKGAVTISGGAVTIQSWGDAVQAQTDLTIEAGTLALTTGGGSAAAPAKASDVWMGHGGNWGAFDGGRGGKFGFDPNAQSNGRGSREDMTQPAVPEAVTPPEGGPNMPESMEGMMAPAEAPASWDYDGSSSVSRKGLKATGSVIITGGEIQIDTEDDAIHAENVTFTGGTMAAASGDDGVHADTLLTIGGGALTVAQAYEGLEAAMIEISGGDICVTSADDGINASDGTASQFGGRGGFGMTAANTNGTLPQLHITGGNLYVNADGDGLDSNGDLLVEGGFIVVDGPANSMNGALDSGSESGGTCIINGGTVLAIGAAGMAESFSMDSAQSYLTCNVNVTAGAEIVISAADGTELIRHTAVKSANSIVFSCAGIADGDTLTICVDGKTTQAIVQRTSSIGGFGGHGFGRW